MVIEIICFKIDIVGEIVVYGDICLINIIWVGVRYDLVVMLFLLWLEIILLKDEVCMILVIYECLYKIFIVKVVFEWNFLFLN